MAGSLERGIKMRQTMIEKLGSVEAVSKYYAEIGKRGGSARSSSKGFGSDKERARLAGAKGGRISRRGPIKVASDE